MTFTRCAAALVLLSAAVSGGEPAFVTFDNIPYELAQVEIAADGAIINEYRAAGESLDDWTTRLSVSVIPDAATINDAINPWLYSIRSKLAKKWSATRTPNAVSDSDVMIEAWINVGPIEVNATLQRFVPDESGSGVKTYRFIQKIDPKDPGARELYQKNRQALMKNLAELNVDVVKDKT